MADTPVERLRQKVSETWTRMQEIQQRADRDGWTAEDRSNWDAANEAIDEQMGDLTRAERMASLDQPDRSGVIPTTGGPTDPADPEGVRSPEETAREYRDAFGAYLREGMGAEANLTTRQRQLLRANHTQMDQRALGQGGGPAGGYLVPPEFRDQVVEVLQSYGGMLPYCNQIITSTGAALSWPTSDDTMNEGVEIAENTAVSEQDVLFDTEQIGAHIYTSKMVRVPWSLMEDTAFDLDGFLTRKFGERLGRIYARRILTGSGNGQPLGLLTPNRGNKADGTPKTPLKIGVTTAVGATPSMGYDSWIELEHSIDPIYRNGGNARYMVSDGGLKMARLLKDGDGRPLWVPIPIPGFPPTLNGYPYFVDNSMAGPTPEGIAAVFGDFRAGMLVRIVQGFQTVRMTERYAELMQTGYFAYSRMDARPDDPKALAAAKFGKAS